jgi:multicomponent Na+:H+ antiporter subunit B
VKGWALALVVVVAATLAIGVVGLPARDTLDAPIHDHVGARYLERGVEETGMRNLVGAVLLNYRGFDTMVEVVVIFTALAAVLALPRGGPVADEPEAVPVSPIVLFVVRLLAPFIALFAIALLFRGHVSPGGGFQAGALFGALFVALGLVLGRRGAARLVPDRARPWLQAAAPLTFAAVAALGWALTGSFLGFPQAPELHAVREAMALALEVAIAVGGGVILASLFQTLEA